MEQLKKLRKQRGLTQAELARIIGVATSTIAMYETGRNKPDVITLKKLADFFGTTIEEIFFGGREDE